MNIMRKCKSGFLGLAGVAAVALILGGALFAKDDAVAKDKAVVPYPLDTCAVSGEKFAADAKPVVETVEGREVRFCCGGCSGKFKADTKGYFKKVDAAIVKQQVAYYPTDVCLIMGEKIMEPVNYVYQNRLFQFCCPMCVRGFKKSPEKTIKRLDEAVVKKEAKSYPLKTCLVSGEKLNDSAVNYVFANQLVKLCCGGCKTAFNKEPTKYMAKKQQAVVKSKG